MTRRFSSLADAKRYVYECLVSTLNHDIDNASGYLFDEGFSERDQERVEEAAQKVILELERKSRPRNAEPRRIRRRSSGLAR